MYYFHHIRRTDGSVGKQIDIFGTLDDAKGAYRAFLGSYDYRADTDFVFAKFSDGFDA